MEPRNLQFVAEACVGELHGNPQVEVSRVCTDSRQVQKGDLFIALAGERFDAHDFAGDASRMAAAMILEHGRLTRGAGRWEANGWKVTGKARAAPLAEGCAIIAVDNTRAALGRLASRYRKDFSLPVFAVGGSNGKTTTKELVAAVLRGKLATLWSEASFNNDIGVPVTLLRLQRDHQAAVFEVGTNHPGELAPLVSMIQPGYAVITNVGREHLEFFGDIEGVVREEGWLAELLPPNGKLLLNGDNPWSTALARRTGASVIRAGFGQDNDWRITRFRLGRNGVAFRVEGPLAQYSGEYRIQLLGRHQAINALFAIIVGAELGLSREEIGRGLNECKPAKMRMQLWERNGVQVLDDAYNANADSMAAALETLTALPCRGRRVAVLGEMAELGIHSAAAHEEVGRRAAELGVDQLFAVGKSASAMGQGARGAGLSRVFEFGDVQAAGAALKQFIRNGDLVLLKASRATRLEQVGDLLRAGDAMKTNGLHSAGK